MDKGKGARFEPINLNFRAQLTASQNPNANIINTSGNEWATFLLGSLDNNTSGPPRACARGRDARLLVSTFRMTSK